MLPIKDPEYERIMLIGGPTGCEIIEISPKTKDEVEITGLLPQRLVFKDTGAWEFVWNLEHYELPDERELVAIRIFQYDRMVGLEDGLQLQLDTNVADSPNNG